MGKPTTKSKSPHFRECPFCHREFGSRSLQIHMPRCRQKNPTVPSHMLEKQLSSCGGSAEESSDNTTPATTSDGNTVNVSQRKVQETYKQPTVITKNASVDNSDIQVSDGDPRTLQRQNTRTIRIHRQRRLSLAGKGISRQRTNSSSRSDDENETSFSDDLNTSWPVMTNKKVKNKKARPSTVIRRTRTVEVPTEKVKNTAPVRFDVAITNSDTTRKNRRKRERERFHAAKKVSGNQTAELVRSAINGTILDLDERPKTATLKRPSILDESLKDKVDMTLTKKELMTAVKLCSDVAVQRGLPNMRIRPKSHVHYNVRPPFHAHHRKQQPSVTLNKGISSSSVISGKGRVVSTPLVHAPSNAKSKYFHQISPKKAAFGSSVEGKSNEAPNTSQANSPYNLSPPTKAFLKEKKRYGIKNKKFPYASHSDEPHSPESLELPKIHTRGSSQQPKSLSPVRQESKDSNLPIPSTPSYRIKPSRTNIHHPISNNLSRQLRLRGSKSNKSSLLALEQQSEVTGKTVYNESSVSPTRNNEKESKEYKEKLKTKKATNKQSKLFLRHKTSDPSSEENTKHKHSEKKHISNQKESLEKVPEPCRSCGRNDLPERLHTHHSIVDSSVKKEVSKIPIRLDSPPKRIETLEEQQVISIARVKTSPSKRSRKYSAVNKAYLSSNTHTVAEEPRDSKAKGETNILNVAGSVGSRMRNWMSPKQKRKNRKPKVKRSLSLEIKDLFMGFVNNNGTSSSTNVGTESKQKTSVDSISSLVKNEDGDTQAIPKRSTSFTSLIPSHIRLHTSRRNKSRAVSATSLTTIKLVELTSSTTDEDENTECSVTNVSPALQNIKVSNRQESIEKSADDESSIMSNVTITNINETRNGKTTPFTEEEGVDDNANNIANKAHTRKDNSPSPEKERVKGLRYSRKERKRWKHFGDEKEQIDIEISISEEPLSLPNLTSENESQYSPKNEAKRERVNTHPVTKSTNRALSSNEVSAITDKSGVKISTDNLKTQEITEKSSTSPVRSSTAGIGVTKCPICGKQFGKSSLRFHQPQCEKKQALLQEKHEQEKLEEKRKESYIIYEDFDAVNENDISNQDMFHIDNGNVENNAAAFSQTFEAIWDAHVENLTPCKHCKRTFFPDRIAKHENSCKGLTTSNLLPRKASISKETSLRNMKNRKNNNSIDISKLIASENLSDDHKMLLASPQPVRRQLHTAQDAVVVVTTKDKMERIKSLGNSQETD